MERDNSGELAKGFILLTATPAQIGAMIAWHRWQLVDFIVAGALLLIAFIEINEYRPHQ